jgi:hypothetical protein
LHFEKLLENIQPPKERLAAAVTLPPKVRTYLEQHQGFPTLSPHSRLVGSYAQFLSVGDVKDVDFLIRVDGDPEQNDPEARKIIRSLKAALDDLPESLELGGYADVEVDGARRSVHVCFIYEDFHLDVVPCIAPDGFDHPIGVPDKGFNRWIESHPVGVVELVKQLEQAHPDKFRNLGRLLKHFRNVQMQRGRPKSYWQLTLLIHAFRDEGFDASAPLGESFANLLDHIYRRLAPTYGRTDGATPNLKDPILDHNVSWNWGRPAFASFMLRLDEGRRWSAQAVEALDDDDADKAIQLWQRVFGESSFPADVTDFARAKAAARQPGAAFVAPTGLILPSPVSPRDLQVPATKYYGGLVE